MGRFAESLENIRQGGWRVDKAKHEQGGREEVQEERTLILVSKEII